MYVDLESVYVWGVYMCACGGVRCDTDTALHQTFKPASYHAPPAPPPLTQRERDRDTCVIVCACVCVVEWARRGSTVGAGVIVF